MNDRIKRLAILGSTGSIGCQTLDVVRRFRERFEIIGLAAGDNIKSFSEQVTEFKPRFIFCNNKEAIKGTHISMEEMASHQDVDLVVIATTGKAGLLPTLAALKATKTVAIANKEILVMAGEIITDLAAKHQATLLPVDSEHSAIWQCLKGEESYVKKVLLTASGGPFLDWPQNKLAAVTVSQALDHPTWKMGRKVTVDSATLFNKGMEVIEAHWLFDIPYNMVEILIHRQSIIHSMVEFIDGSVKAQLGPPDMHLPIQYALFYPKRVSNPSLPRIDYRLLPNLTFEPVDYSLFPCLRLALQAAHHGSTYPAALCAADEIAVQLFLENKIKFTEIAHIIETVLSLHRPAKIAGLQEIETADAWARETALGATRKGI